MRVLVCNDDGVDAPGIARAAAAARTLADDVWIVAPEVKWTAASHRVSFDRDLVLTRRAPRTWSCSGTPADCVVAAMSAIEGGLAPDLVVAGINDKRNVGEDAAYSGTMAIAREAAMRAIPAIALSHERKDDYAGPERAWLTRLITTLYAERSAWCADGGFLAVNLPARLPAEIAFPSLARDKIAAHCDIVRRDPDEIVARVRRGRPGTRAPGDENDVLAHGAIAIVRHRWHGALTPDAAWGARLRRALAAGR